MLNDGQPFTATQAPELTGRRGYRLVASGLAREVLRGVYVDATVPDELCLRARAAALALPPGAVLCRSTVAWLRGIGDLRLPGRQHEPPVVECVVEQGRAPLRRRGLRCYEAPLTPADVVQDAGPARTSDLRTVLDLARWLPRPMAMAAIDAAAALSLVDIHHAQAELERFRGHRGAAQARQLLGYAEPLTESFGESWLRLRVLDAGYPRPTAQVQVRGRSGELVYRLDLGLERVRVGMEYDGEDHHSTPQQQRHDALRREVLLKEHGWTVVGFHRGHVWGQGMHVEHVVGDLLGLEPRIGRRLW